MQTTAMSASVPHWTTRKVLVFKWTSICPRICFTSSFAFSVACFLWCMTPKVGNTQVLVGGTMSLSVKLTHCTPGLLPLEYFPTATHCNGITLKHTEAIMALKCWNLASRKCTEKFRGAVCLAKVEVGWCRKHGDLNPAVLSSNESLDGPPVFRICVQGPSHHGDSAEKAKKKNLFFKGWKWGQKIQLFKCLLSLF